MWYIDLQATSPPHFCAKERKCFQFRKTEKVRVGLENAVSESSFCSSFENTTEIIFWLILQKFISIWKKQPRYVLSLLHKSSIQTSLVTAQSRVLWLTFYQSFQRGVCYLRLFIAATWVLAGWRLSPCATAGVEHLQPPNAPIPNLKCNSESPITLRLWYVTQKQNR